MTGKGGEAASYTQMSGVRGFLSYGRPIDRDNAEKGGPGQFLQT